jgi:recombination protein RecT
MATNGKNSDLKNKLAERANTPIKGNDPANTIAAYLKKMEGEIARALPKHMNADRLSRIALTVIRTNPTLLQCSVPSLLAAVMQCAQLGLEPGLLGHAYLVPFRNNKTGTMEVQFIIGYRGMIDLARRSGNIQSIAAHEVYENDYFVLKYGLEDTLEHIPWHLREDKQFDEPGAFRGCYMIAKFKDGGYQIHYMSKKEIDDHRKRSKAGNSGPWVTDYVEMAKKTVVRAAWKWLPISVEIMRGVEATDETVKNQVAEDMTEVPSIDVSYSVAEEAMEETQPEKTEAQPGQEAPPDSDQN